MNFENITSWYILAPLSVDLDFAESILTELETTTVECTVRGGSGNTDLTLWRNDELLAQVNGDYLLYTTTPRSYGNYTCAVSGTRNSSVLYERGMYTYSII